ncbi:MAG: TonB-dependent receptor [Flavobacteriaceae bacterium]|nr:TonB-dependent receptor [Flavobacteriaceae bacterium]
MKRRTILLLLFVFITTIAISQITVTGVVKDNQGEVLPGATITVQGTNNGTTSNFEGTYTLQVKKGETLTCSYIGYSSVHVKVVNPTHNFILLGGQQLNEIQIVGSRSKRRTATETTVAVDIIDVAELSSKTGVVEVNELLQFAAPSFNANKQSGSDGADHIVPATLRGLGPDQTLVLINGKRRHQSSLINVYGTRGRGNTGTDLNTIPAGAIKRIEVLRDGASAQYGSDAIAGVINIVLKDNVNEFTGSITTGISNAIPPSKYPIKTDKNRDGLILQATANYGFKIKETGFANFTLDLVSKDFTNRPADPTTYDIYREKFGDAAMKGVNLMGNIKIPLTSTTDLYAFGGYNVKDTESYAWTRAATDLSRNVPSIYPNGFNPLITSIITDFSASVGIRTNLGGWDVDLNNTIGQNKFIYTIKNTLNASLQEASPTTFDAGGHQFLQNTTSVDFSKYFENTLAGLNIAMGAEFRVENFKIFAGEEKSYKNYDENYASGSQGFPGFQEVNITDESRNNIAVYVDTEIDFSEKTTTAIAIRYENYNDFGSTLTAKLAFRQAFTDALAFRTSISTGFRAPSLAQRFYNTTITDFQGGVAQETIIANNESALAEAFGIEKLKEETALSIGAGFTYNQGRFSATIDGYYAAIKDRIVLSGGFDASGLILGVSNAQFFSNALDTKTIGIDIVLSYNTTFGNSKLGVNLVGNINNMELGDVHVNEKLKGKEDTFFGLREKYFLLASAPNNKFSLNTSYEYKKLSTNLRFTRFGKVELIDWLDTIDTYSPKITTDFSATYPLCNRIKLTMGANNIFNIYPDIQDTETESGGLWDPVQMGFSGAFYYARIAIKI